MPKGERDAAQRKRAEARERRRKQSSEERNDQTAAADGDSTEEEPLAAVKQAAKVAAAGAAVGAAAAAARALSKHDEREDEQERDEAPAEEGKAPLDEEEREQEPEPRQQPEAEVQEQEESPPEPREAWGRSTDGRQSRDDRAPGASPNEARDVVRQAREQLANLLGREPEAVSAMERTHNGWLVTVEVVEVSRIPESTDVLASYEIELDEDRNLRRYARVRRYYRSQADQGAVQ